MKKTILKTGSFLVFLSVLQAQGQSSLWLQPKGEAPKEYDFDTFRSISIKNGELVLNKVDGTTEAYGVRQTRKLSFTKDGVPTSLISDQISSFPTKVYPNPLVGNMVTVRCELPASGAVAISLLNMDGSVQRETSLQGQSGQNVLQWELKDLPSGVYLYQVKAGDKIATGKLIK